MWYKANESGTMVFNKKTSEIKLASEVPIDGSKLDMMPPQKPTHPKAVTLQSPGGIVFNIAITDDGLIIATQATGNE